MKSKTYLMAIIILIGYGILLNSCEDSNDNNEPEPQNNPPTCSITSPVDNSEISQGESVEITVNADDIDGNLKEVRFYVNETGIGLANNFPYKYTWDTDGYSVGQYSLIVVAIDEKQAEARDTVVINLAVVENVISDVDGNVYKTVIIGNQEWMAENLKTTKYNDGTSISLVTDNSEWQNLTSGAYCWYENDENNYKDNYGALYNWYTIATEKVCPSGWHVPTNQEWLELTEFISQDGHDGFIGKVLKTTKGWANERNGTNVYKFSAFPSGLRNLGYGTFDKIGERAYWWTSTSYSETDSWARYIGSEDYDVLSNFLGKKNGFSIRCVKD